MGKIAICEKIIPYSYLPGTRCVVPCSDWVVEVFPALLRIVGKRDFAIEIVGPIKQFLVELDLERDCVWISGKARGGCYRLQLTAAEEGLFVTMRRAPKTGIVIAEHHLVLKRRCLLASGGKVLLKSVCERLSLGNWKAQDVELIRKRSDVREIVPTLFLLGQKILPTTPTISGPSHKFLPLGLRESPGIEIDREGGSIEAMPPPSVSTQSRELSRESQCKEFTGKTPRSVLKMEMFFRASFSGLFVPHLQDPLHQGYHEHQDILPIKGEEGDPMALLGLAYRTIRECLIEEGGQCVSIMPGIKEYPVGRARLRTSFGWIYLEWTQGVMRRMIVEPKEHCQIAFVFPKEVSSFRCSGQKVLNGDVVSFVASSSVLFDRFLK